MVTLSVVGLMSLSFVVAFLQPIKLIDQTDNISEEMFELRIRDMESCNEWIRKCKREGKNYKITRLDDKYFNQRLNYK